MENYRKSLKTNSRKLWNTPTDAEQKLWQRLRHKQLAGIPFNRQKPISNYIVDFYCAKAKLVVEIDGAQHFEGAHQLRDTARDKALQALELQVLRFDNRQVLLNLEAVVEVIYCAVCKRIKS